MIHHLITFPSLPAEIYHLSSLLLLIRNFQIFIHYEWDTGGGGAFIYYTFEYVTFLRIRIDFLLIRILRNISAGSSPDFKKS